MSGTFAVVGWIVLAVAVILCELVARVRRRVPSAVDAARALHSTTVGGWLIAAVWLWVGWHLFVRRR